MPHAEGRVFAFDDLAAIRADFLETFPFEADTQKIAITTHEFTAVCPFSGLPDYGTIEITYYPTGGCCVELKALKYYLLSFRNVGIYQEAVTHRIYTDLVRVLSTDRLQLVVRYRTRGGVDTVCSEGQL